MFWSHFILWLLVVLFVIFAVVMVILIASLIQTGQETKRLIASIGHTSKTIKKSTAQFQKQWLVIGLVLRFLQTAKKTTTKKRRHEKK